MDENCGEKGSDCEAAARQCPQEAGSATLILHAREGCGGITSDGAEIKGGFWQFRPDLELIDAFLRYPKWY